MTENDTPAPAYPGFGLAPTPGGGWTPVPDPTKLTTEQLRRELATQREILEAQLGAVKASIEERLDAADAANLLRLKAFDRIPADVNERIGHLKELHGERFASIALQFSERDTRTEQAATAQKQALDAALQAAKELVNAQGESAAAAALKAEGNTTKQIDQIVTLIQTNQKAVDDRLLELKERIDRGEGGQAGAAETRSESRDTGAEARAIAAVEVAAAQARTARMLGAIGAAVGVLALLVAAIATFAPHH